MSFFTVKVTLPRTAELTICARKESVAEKQRSSLLRRHLPMHSTSGRTTSRSPMVKGRPSGEVQIEMSNEGMIELAPGAVEITGRRESLQ